MKNKNKPIIENKIWKKQKSKKSFLMSNSFCFTDEKNSESNSETIKSDSKSDPIPISKKKEMQTNIIEKNNVIKERLVAIDKILEMYPNLKKDKREMVTHVLGKQPVEKELYIVEKIDVKNTNAYMDNFGNLIDPNANLIGFWTEIQTNSESGKEKQFAFFNEIKKITTRITKNKNKIDKFYYSKVLK